MTAALLRGRATALARASAATSTLTLALAVALTLPGMAQAQAAASAAPADVERLVVADPFLELHTGPGRGYPVFFVVEKGQAITIELRRTDWFRVRAPGGQTGWVPRRQLEATLTAGGVPKSFRDILLDDYLARRVEAGMAYGRFDGEPMVRLHLGWRLAETVALELAGGQVQGTFSGTDFWHVGVVVEPWADRRLSPFVGVGIGTFRNIPNASLVDAATTNAKLAHATAGLRWYISERFVLRADTTLYTAFVADSRSTEYRAVTLGLGFFF